MKAVTVSWPWSSETWNPVTGCTKVSSGCKNCYAEQQSPRVFAGQTVNCGGAIVPRRFTDIRTHDARLDQPLRWRRPRRIFVNSFSDLFHEAVTTEFIDRVFAVMALCPQHTFQVLTKRPERMRSYMARLSKPVAECSDGPIVRAWNILADAAQAMHMSDEAQCQISNSINEALGNERMNVGWPMRNVWLGVSCEDQRAADERIPILLQTPAAVRFLSCEPLIGPIDLRRHLNGWCPKCGGDGNEGHFPTRGEIKDGMPSGPRVCPRCLVRVDGLDDRVRTVGGETYSFAGIDWVIVGGEIGPKARPCDVAWIRSIVAQCKTAGVACFVKQLGALPFEGDGVHAHVAGDRAMGVICDQGDPCPHCGKHPTTHWYREELNDHKGGDPAEWPEDLRVREFPEVRR